MGFVLLFCFLLYRSPGKISSQLIHLAFIDQRFIDSRISQGVARIGADRGFQREPCGKTGAEWLLNRWWRCCGTDLSKIEDNEFLVHFLSKRSSRQYQDLWRSAETGSFDRKFDPSFRRLNEIRFRLRFHVAFDQRGWRWRWKPSRTVDVHLTKNQVRTWGSLQTLVYLR